MELDGACVRNLNDKKIKGKHWVSIFIDRNTAVYFCSLGIEYNSKEVLKEIKDKSNTHNIIIPLCVGFYYFQGIYACRKNFVRLY